MSGSHVDASERPAAADARGGDSAGLTLAAGSLAEPFALDTATRGHALDIAGSGGQASPLAALQ